MATKKDYWLVSIIGIAVGLLVQPIISNNLPKGGDCLYSFVACEPNPSPPLWLIRLAVLIFFTFLAPLALFIASYIGKKIPVIYQFSKFAAVGSLNSFVDLGIFNLLASFFVEEIKNISKVLFITFKSVSFLVATLNSYLWNKNWTFGDREKTHAETIVKFYIITLINYFLNTGVAFVVREVGPDANYWVSFVAPVCGILAAMFSNFLAYKFIVFKDESPKPIVPSQPA